MNREDYLTSMRRALESPHGIALDFDNWVQADRARRRIYSLRDAVRRAGNTDFDNLSLVMQRGGGTRRTSAWPRLARCGTSTSSSRNSTTSAGRSSA